jgi:hypothetical protein
MMGIAEQQAFYSINLKRIASKRTLVICSSLFFPSKRKFCCFGGLSVKAKTNYISDRREY